MSVYAPDRTIAERWGISTRTLARRDKNPPEGWPRPYYIAGRRMRLIAEVEAYERACAAATRAEAA